MGEGYWVWMIPLASGLLRLGVVYDKSVVTDPPKTEAEFVAFLREHRMLRDALDGAELVDYGRMENFARKPTHYLGADRTAWIGTAAGFVDPLYSSGLDFIALQCEYLLELLRREQQGEPLDPQRLHAYNDFLEQYFEQTVRFFARLYKTFVSQELVLPRYRRDVHIYWNLYTWPYFSGQFLDPAFLEQHTAVAHEAMRRSEFFARVFEHAYDRLKASDALHRKNAGRYTFNQLGYRIVPWIRFERHMGHPVPAERRQTLLREIDPLTLLELLDVMFDGERSPLRGLLYPRPPRRDPRAAHAPRRHHLRRPRPRRHLLGPGPRPALHRRRSPARPKRASRPPSSSPAPPGATPRTTSSPPPATTPPPPANGSSPSPSSTTSPTSPPAPRPTSNPTSTGRPSTTPPGKSAPAPPKPSTTSSAKPGGRSPSAPYPKAAWTAFGWGNG